MAKEQKNKSGEENFVKLLQKTGFVSKLRNMYDKQQGQVEEPEASPVAKFLQNSGIVENLRKSYEKYQKEETRKAQAREGAKILSDSLQKVFDTFSKRERGDEQSTNSSATPVQESSTDVVEYTYKPGDTFGQVINDLGLRTSHGLWGANGDVEYYTKQLEQQGIWPAGTRGNIPIGTTIKLRRRK